MKKYVKPMMEGQMFTANEYVAACGDENKVYKFTCDAGGGRYGDVYLETNGVEGLQTNNQWIQTGKYPWEGYMQSADNELTSFLSQYHACGKTHEASTTDDFLNGYYVVENEVTKVIVWKGPNKDNVHCTTNLNINSWETAKS